MWDIVHVDRVLELYPHGQFLFDDDINRTLGPELVCFSRSWLWEDLFPMVYFLLIQGRSLDMVPFSALRLALYWHRQNRYPVVGQVIGTPLLLYLLLSFPTLWLAWARNMKFNPYPLFLFPSKRLRASIPCSIWPYRLNMRMNWSGELIPPCEVRPPHCGSLYSLIIPIR